MIRSEKTVPYLNVANAATKDLGVLSDLYTFSIKCNPSGFVQDISFHGSLEMIIFDLKSHGGDFLVGKLHNRIIAMGGLRKVSEKRVELCKLHVHPKFHGYGYGKEMTNRLIRRAEELSFEEMELHVTNTQKAALGLYRSLGFYETDQKVYYLDLQGEKKSFDTVYMEKKLG